MQFSVDNVADYNDHSRTDTATRLLKTEGFRIAGLG